MNYAVRLSELALRDLIELHAWIVGEADRDIADRFLDRIHERLESLAAFPNRGTPRDELGLGMRSLTFERRIIAYRVDEGEVLILRIVHGARDLDALTH